MSSEEIRRRTQAVWDQLLQLAQHLERGRASSKHQGRASAFVLISKLYRQMYANTGIATDSARVQRSAKRARLIGRAVRRFFISRPMPDLAVPEMKDDRARPACSRAAASQRW